jgi:hypothetical protein
MLLPHRHKIIFQRPSGQVAVGGPRLDQVMCGMDGCEANESGRHYLVFGPFTGAVWDPLPVMSRRCDAMTASGSRLASAAARSTRDTEARSSCQATVLNAYDW